jgi:sugar phosphate isomerase/epimerase
MKYCFNWLAFEDLTQRFHSSTARLNAIRDIGYDGVQFVEPLTSEQDRLCSELGLWRCSSGRANTPAEVGELARRFADEGQNCATLHLGWGIEEDAEAQALIEAVLGQDFPLFVETHRATLFQDMWQAVDFVRRYPDLRFNGDFSHWYTGQEMVYGGFGKKLEFIRPVIERVRFIHGRIGTPGAMQVALPRVDAPEPSYVQHFRTLWTECFRTSQVVAFASELLSPAIYYGRSMPDGSEEADRWSDSLRLREIARECARDAGHSG